MKELEYASSRIFLQGTSRVQIRKWVYYVPILIDEIRERRLDANHVCSDVPLLRDNQQGRRT
jgi:hypothetical protein